ncbi:MAG: PD-(D/E)XK nuclease family protein [Dehalococcoidia bacterium]
MPGLTLVTGGPASGKTARLLDVARGHYRHDPFSPVLVLVPTARHADQFRQRLVASVGVAIGLEVTTARLFATGLTAEAPIAPPEVAGELLARAVRGQAAGVGPARRFESIAHTPGLHAMVRAGVGELCRAAVDPDVLVAAAERLGQPDLLALAALYAGYLEVLGERGWHPPEARARLAAQALDVHPLAPLVLVDSMQFLEPGEVELVAGLARRSEVWLALDETSGARAAWTLAALEAAVPDARREVLPAAASVEPGFEAFSAADHDAQLREVARSIKRQLADDRTLRPSDVAVTMRQVGPHLAASRRVFREFDLPLDPAAGERLSERPFGVWVLRLLRLGAHGWRLLDVLDALEGGWFDRARAGIAQGELDRLRRIGRRHQLWSGLEALRRLPEATRVEVEAGAEAPDTATRDLHPWLATLDRLSALLDPDVSRTPGEHATGLDAALFGLDGLVRDPEDDVAFTVERAALRRDLDAFRAVDDALGATALPFAAFVDLLEARLQRPTTLIREAGGVLLAPMHTLHGLRFRRVYVVGLAEGEFPAPRPKAGLLSPATRRALAEADIDLPPESRATEDELWRGAITRALHTSLWRPRFDDRGRQAAPSYYFVAAARSPVNELPLGASPEDVGSMRELALSLTRRWPDETRRPRAFPAWELVVGQAAAVEQRRRSFATAGRFEGDLPGLDVAPLVGGKVEWSASRLESYLTCPFQFFGHYGLLLRELDEEQSEADAATRGTVIHAILEDALAPLAGRGGTLDERGLAEAIEGLRTRGRAIWEAAPQRYAFGREALWRHQGEQTLRRLERLLHREAARQQEAAITSIAANELILRGPLPGIDPPLLVQARIDRLDRGGDGGVEVIDYKSGQPIPKADLDGGRRLQLQLYALLAGEQFGTRSLVGRYAYVRPPKGEWLLDNARNDDRQLLEAAVSLAAEVRDEVAAGRFAVAPAGDCPGYCAARTLCRVNHFSRTKTWS